MLLYASLLVQSKDEHTKLAPSLTYLPYFLAALYSCGLEKRVICNLKVFHASLCLIIQSKDDHTKLAPSLTYLPHLLAALYSCGLEKRVMYCYASQHEVHMSMIINQIFCYCILEHVCKDIADPI